MKTLSITLPYDQDLGDHLKTVYPWVDHFKIISKSLDARRAPLGRKPVYLYQVEAFEKNQQQAYQPEVFEKIVTPIKPLIIGSGPAGLFCALRLAEYGIASTILERGDRVPERMRKIAKYWRYGELDQESNVCFGEGGAGLYSDGKLITRIKSDYISYVMNKFVQFGAPADTAYLANPHLGSNKIRALIGFMTKELETKGCQLIFNTKVVDFIFDKSGKTKGVILSNGEKLYSPHVVVATGHSAQEIYHVLHHHGVAMEAKDFAVGVRIEHPRGLIDQLQYGAFASDQKLGAARYRLSYHDEESERGTYSFCMCPGGYVLASSTDKEGLVTNGMSNFACNSPWSNAALVVNVKTSQDCDIKKYGPLAGLRFIEEIEHKAFALSKEFAHCKELPAQRVEDFMIGEKSIDLPTTSTPSQLVSINLADLLPTFIINHLKNALSQFDKNIPGFMQQAVLIAPETRTSSPVTITRDKQSFESVSHHGLYPCGEGAGYAGGITSAAVDGIKVAESIRMQVSSARALASSTDF